MSKALEMLYGEHDVIISAVGITDSLKNQLLQNASSYEINIRHLIHFLKRYADHYHHFKEETILFPAMSKKNEILEDGIIKEMEDHHEEFREMIKSIEICLDKKEFDIAQKQLELYVTM